MRPLNTETALERLIDQTEVTKRENLGESEYLEMIMAFCCDRRPMSGNRSHADTIDFDDPVMDAGLDLIPSIYELLASQKDMEAAKLCAVLGRLAFRAVVHAANEKIDDLFYAKREKEADRKYHLWAQTGIDDLADAALERHRDKAMGCL